MKVAGPFLFYQTWIFSPNTGVTKPWQRGRGRSLAGGWLSRAGSDGSPAAPGAACSVRRLVESPGVATLLPKPGTSRISIYCTSAWTVYLRQDFMNAFIKRIKGNLKLDSSVMWSVLCTATDCATSEFPFSFFFCPNGFWEKNGFLN